MSSCTCPTKSLDQLDAEQKRTGYIIIAILGTFAMIMTPVCVNFIFNGRAEREAQRQVAHEEIIAKTIPTRTGSRVMLETFSNNDVCFVRVNEYFPKNNGTFVNIPTQTEKVCSSKN